MARCPDCNGTGYCLIINPITDPTDPQPSIHQIPVGCGRCNRTGSLSDGQAAPPAIPASEEEKLTHWSMVLVAVCLIVVIVLVVVWPFGP
jgi:hypothetical protein